MKKEYGHFENDGKTYVVTTPYPPSSFDNYLFNDEYRVVLNQRMEGESIRMAPNFANDKHKNGDNHFYATYNGTPYILCRGKGESYRCEYQLHQSELTERFDDFEVKIRMFVPVKGKREIWTVTVTNLGKEKAEIGTFAAFPFAKMTMQCEARADAQGRFIYRTGLPGYHKYDDYERCKSQICFDYVISDIRPTSYECNRLRFFGCDYAEGIPAAVGNGRCENGSYEQDWVAPIGVTHHAFVLEAGQSASVNFQLGRALSIEQMVEIADHFPNVEEECRQVKELWEERCSVLTVETPDTELNYLTNYWLKRQLTYFTRLNRGGTYCPIRNQLQDYLGYAILDPEFALERTIRILERQEFNGHIKQYYNTDGAPETGLCLMRHSDACIWLILCTIEVVEKTGDASIYQREVGYKDSPLREPIITHLLKAARYMATQMGEHGLCLMLDGDWNDPVNGPGRGGKGESGWNSMAFTYALSRLLQVHPDAYLEDVRDRLKQSINEHLWDGEWYAAGINDDGVHYGVHTDEQAQKFLNTQTWAIISGVVTGERLQKVVETIETMKVPFGYRLIDPPFSKYDPIWGRVSAKQPGTTENGSVYCHSVMFKILGDCMRSDGEAAYSTMMSMLPTNPDHDPSWTRQIPIYYSNFYFGYPSENFGFSSLHYRTGTVAWHFWVLLEYMIGFRAGATTGIELKPCLPKAWDRVKVTRRYGGKVYTLTIDGDKHELAEQEITE
ncbi:MAG: hypothetical protein IIX15_04805 [Clostridia bacterium]|nr:hypothetical protein [Clostridia bacterium]